MKIIHKYILKELLLTFVLSLLALNFILMIEKLIRLSKFLSGVGSTIIDMSTIIIYLQPQLFILTIPMSLLLSTLLVYGRLNMDNEIVIMKNSGMNFFNISLPVLILGSICMVLNLLVSFYIGPKSNIKLREQVSYIFKTRVPLSIEAGSFNNIFKDILIMVKEKNEKNEIKGIFIYDDRNKNEPRVIYANKGIIFPQNDLSINFYLEDGYINIMKGISIIELFFKKYNMILNLEADTPPRKNSELTPNEILKELIVANKNDAIDLYLELYRRITLPFLCIILIFFGPPLSLKAGKTGKLGGLTIGFSTFTIYYMILVYCENLVKAHYLPYYIGAILPTIIIGIISLIFFSREYSR